VNQHLVLPIKIQPSILPLMAQLEPVIFGSRGSIDTFATRIDDLSAEWVRSIRHELHANSVRAVESAAVTFFGAVTDSIRAASRIVQARNLTPEAIRETCNLGFSRIFRTRGQ
jgi:hypothetical protein